MKKLMLSIAALAAIPLAALHAQNINAAWQGKLKVGPADLRIVMKISLEDDKLKAVMYSIDQGGTPIPGSHRARRFQHQNNHRRDWRQL